SHPPGGKTSFATVGGSLGWARARWGLVGGQDELEGDDEEDRAGQSAAARGWECPSSRATHARGTPRRSRSAWPSRRLAARARAVRESRRVRDVQPLARLPLGEHTGGRPNRDML